MPWVSRPFTLALALAALLPMGACVTEVIPVRPWSDGVDADPKAATGKPGAKTSTRSPTPTGGPGNQPIPVRSASMRVRFAVRPLGTVPYDGATLPLFSPDGSRVITQLGRLGGPATGTGPQPDAAQPGRSLRVYSIAPTGLSAVAWPEPSDPRITLGRTTATDSALVQRPEAGGLISIGRIAWLSGEVNWLASNVAGPGQAIELRNGTLVRIAEAGPDPAASLEPTGDQPGPAGEAQVVFERPGQQPEVLAFPGMHIAWPLATPDQRFIAVLGWPVTRERALGDVPSAMELIVIALPRAADAAASPLSSRSTQIAQVVRRIPLALPGDRATAEACTSSIEAAPADVEGALASTIVLLHPRLQRVVLVDCASGRTAQLAEGSIAAGAASVVGSGGSAEGLLVAQSQRVVWQGIGPSQGTGASIALQSPTRAVEGSYIPRLLPGGEAILLGPGPADGLSLSLTGVSVLPAREN